MKNCCGCFNMRNGVTTIGTLGLVLSVFALVLQFIVFAYQKQIMLDENDHSGNNLFSFIFIMGIVVCFFKLISDCLLICGAINQTTREVSVWLAINLCTIIYVFIIMVFICDLFVGHKTNITSDNVCILEAFLFITNVFYIYIWYQVYLFSRQLDLDGRTSLEGILQITNTNP